MAFDFRFATRDVSFRYSNNPFYDFFYFGSWEEIIIFAVIFIIGFVVSYTGLKRFFTETEGAVYRNAPDGTSTMVKGSRTVVRNKNALIVISLGIAILMALGISRSGWLFHYFGDVAGGLIVFILTGIFLVIIGAIFKVIEKSFGKTEGAFICSAMLWSGVAGVVYFSDSFSDLPLRVQEILSTIATPGYLVGFLIVGVIIGKIMSR